MLGGLALGAGEASAYLRPDRSAAGVRRWERRRRHRDAGVLNVALLLDHGVGDREYAYTTAAEKSLAKAKELGWTVVSMKLRSVPDVFSLDSTHAPHVTTLQRFVRTADLDRVYDAVEKTIAGTDVSALKLRAIAIRHADWVSLDKVSPCCRSSPTPPCWTTRRDFLALSRRTSSQRERRKHS